MEVNKVEYDGDTLIDLTADTVTPESLVLGATAHDAAGKEITGVADFGISSTSPTSPLTDSADGMVQKLTVLGRSRKSKNLWTNGDINLQAAAYTDYPVNLVPGTYTFSGKRTTDDPTKTVSLATVLDANLSEIGNFTITGVDGMLSSATFTINSIAKYIRIYRASTAVASSNSLSISEIQLEEGSTATDFEPYFDGIKSVWDETGTVTTSNSDNTVSTSATFSHTLRGIKTSKNKLEITAESQTINGVTFTVDKTAGTVAVNGTATSNIALKIGSFYAQEKTDYTISGAPNSSQRTYRLFVIEPCAAFPVGHRLSTDENLGEGVAQTALASEAVNISIDVISGTTLSGFVFKPMICTAADYDADPTFEPYTGALPEDATYTDSNEVSWCSDELDVNNGSGKVITRVAYDSTTDTLSKLATPTVTPLTAAEVAQFRSLRTYDSTTNITITDDPEFSIDYLRNTDNGQAVANMQTGLQTQLDSKITVSAPLTLTAEGWDSTTMQQTVTFEHDTSRRNVIDIDMASLKAWAAAGIYAVSETASGITFECSAVPGSAISFRVTSMEVTA